MSHGRIPSKLTVLKSVYWPALKETEEIENIEARRSQISVGRKHSEKVIQLQTQAISITKQRSLRERI